MEGLIPVLEKIDARLDLALSHMDTDQYDDLFPIILDDLKYILVDFNEDLNALSHIERFRSNSHFLLKITAYYAKLAKVYFKLIHRMDVSIINLNEFSLAVAAAGYNPDDNTIYYSDMGAIISRQTKLSFLHTCLHEGRHQMQFDYFKSDDFLSFPPYMLKLLKEIILEEGMGDAFQEFYMRNYDLFFTENDSELFAQKEIYFFLHNLYKLYIHNHPEKNTKELFDKMAFVAFQTKKILSEENYQINRKIHSQLFQSEIENIRYAASPLSDDPLIAMDKNLKSHPELQEKYPILKLLFKGDVPKTYDEIIADRESFKVGKSLEEQRTINVLYDYIIRLDPILSLTDLLEIGFEDLVQDYLQEHPTLMSEYPEEIQFLKEKYGEFDHFTK